VDEKDRRERATWGERCIVGRVRAVLGAKRCSGHTVGDLVLHRFEGSI